MPFTLPRWLLRGAISIVALVVLVFPLAAQELPVLTGRVVDNAGIIDATAEQALEAKLAEFEQKSSDQIVVATITSLGGEAIEPYANRLFRHWGLGQVGENNGVLLLVAYEDRSMRIEVGYGLEGTLTDLHSKLIIENTMVPAFRAGNFSAGISGAVDDIVMVLEGNAAELEQRARRNPSALRNAPSPLDIFGNLLFYGFITLWVFLFFGSFGVALLAPVFGYKTGPRRYRWLGMDFDYNNSGNSGGSGRRGSGWSSGSRSSGWSSGGGGFSGGGGSSGGGGASGRW